VDVADGREEASRVRVGVALLVRLVLEEPLDQEVLHYLRVDLGLERVALAHELAAGRVEVDQVAVGAGPQAGPVAADGLPVAEEQLLRAAAGRGVARVGETHRAAQLPQVVVLEHDAGGPEAAVVPEELAVMRRDAGRVLAAGVEPVRGLDEAGGDGFEGDEAEDAAHGCE
jgi:hypothetical protein